MGKYLKQLAEQAGLTDEDIASIADLLPTQPQPDLAPTPTRPQDYTSFLGTPQKDVPDVVDPFQDRSNIQVTQGPSEFHTGSIDDATIDTNQTAVFTNPIGGVGFSGTVPGWNAGFGNYGGTIGANPQELADMTPEERVRMSTTAQSILSQNPTNEQAAAMFAEQFPGKNVQFSGHLAEVPDMSPNGVATGSAQMTMGNTGNSSGPHAHTQGIDAQGYPATYQNMLDMRGLLGKMPPPPPTDFNQLVQQELRKRIK